MSVTKHLGRMKTLGAIVTQNIITQVMLLVVFQINSIQKNIKFHEEIFGILSKSIDMITITTYVMSVTKRFGGLKTLSVIVIQNLVKKLGKCHITCIQEEMIRLLKKLITNSILWIYNRVNTLVGILKRTCAKFVHLQCYIRYSSVYQDVFLFQVIKINF